jgi:hypothetical protein
VHCIQSILPYVYVLCVSSATISAIAMSHCLIPPFPFPLTPSTYPLNTP